MSNYFSHYCRLISSPEHVAICCQIQSLSELLAYLKNLWCCPQLNNDELLSEINRLNQIPIDLPVVSGSSEVSLAGRWLPYRYQTKGQWVKWLVPVGHATEPFQDETISRYRQLLLNQIVQPCTTLAFAQQAIVAQAQPAGFIFHLSRCGSTLVSGCLSELESTCVFSESPLLTELLLDQQLSQQQLQVSLRTFINLQAAAFPQRPHMVIKWNAWDIFYWHLIREMYPDVPVVFLVRDPVEILASHKKFPGRHMVGDTLLTQAFPQLHKKDYEVSGLDYPVHVIASLLDEMSAATSGSCVMDYSQLGSRQIVALCRFFCGELDNRAERSINNRLRFHSKHTDQMFANDSVKKRQVFDSHNLERINAELGQTYQRLINNNIKAEVTNA
ncbi:sulfotransferase family protein [Cellvibrio fontiphilus]|uniref:Sulfotransferase family protein n=1 Tax=Cellvibrio fontiphilus TaxID=1815559 RepID=A0ABV7FKD2_9GAMM